MFEMYDLIYQEYELIEDFFLDLVWILLESILSMFLLSFSWVAFEVSWVAFEVSSEILQFVIPACTLYTSETS